MYTVSSDLVRPLQVAQNEFLEVLIPRFSLERKGNGVCLEVSYDGETPAIWNQKGKYDVWRSIADFQRKASVYQARFDDFLMNGVGTRYDFDDPDFPFRYVSGGTLPIVRIKEKEFYCFFYREIFPVGWNIANGGSDNNEELINPLLTMERELREELIVLDTDIKKRYVFRSDAEKALDQPEFAIPRRVWKEWFPGLDVGGFEELTIPLKWVIGPDSVAVRCGTEAPSLVSGCFLNINADDFGIEVDNISKMDLSEGVILCDGEVIRGKLLNNPVGLFEVDRLNRLVREGSQEFIPDLFFHSAKRYPGEDLGSVISRHILENPSSIRSQEEIEFWRKTFRKYDLCPVSRRIVRRYLSLYAGEPENPKRPFDYFVSFGGKDVELAERVYKFLENKNKRGFLSKESRDVNYSRAIDEALASAKCLIAVASNPQNLLRPWPEYEWRLFHNDIRCGVKTDGKIISIVSGFSPASLPGPLRFYQAIDCTGRRMQEGLSELETYLW